MKGIVLKSTGNLYHVEYDSGIARCVLKGNFKIKGIRSTNPVAVGDHVEFEFQKNTETSLITKILERKNYIIRKSTNLSKQTHVIAANIDIAVLMITIAKPVTYTQFIDRYLAACEAFNIEVLLVLNKIDLLNEEQNKKAEELMSVYRKVGYTCIPLSVKQNININLFKTYIDGKTIVISGNSGVGKSSIINLLDAEKKLKVSEISDAHEQGKHTTTFAEMHRTGNGYIIDTPGIKGFGTIGIEKDNLSRCFPEIRALQKACKFSNCTHIHEPGCAVKKAVEDLEIDPGRYKNYLSIYFDDDTRYRQEEYL
jgi:ribosome biogenesis GTPase / thiamine phosphate phosphatase